MRDKVINLWLCLALGIGWLAPVQAGSGPAPVFICDNGIQQQYLPMIIKAGFMANINPAETLEKLLQDKPDFPFDGRITEIFTESVSVRRVGSRTIVRDVALPDHIPYTTLKKGQAVKLNEHLGKSMVVAVFPQFDQDLDYSGKGTAIPDPPHIAVVALSDGWHVTWAAVPGTERYRVYRNDTPDETSVDEVGYVSGTSIVVPYESPYIYFAVKSVSGLNESEVSGWVTDDTAPAVPDTFAALGDILGHELTIGGDDASLAGPGFQCWEVQWAYDGTGTGATSLGYLYPDDFPNLRTFGRGTVRYYRIRSIDYAGNVSDWTDWDYAYAGQDDVQDKFDGYGGASVSDLSSLFWLKIDNFDALWSGTNLSLVAAQEGAYGNQQAIAAGSTWDSGVDIWKSVSLDLSAEGRFTDDDYVIFTYSIGGADHDQGPLFRFVSPIGPPSYTQEGRAYGQANGTAIGTYHVKFKKSDLIENAEMDWTDVYKLEFLVGGNAVSASTITLDDLQIAKADPDDPDTFNDTGSAWDIAANTGTDFGEWHIYNGNRTGEPSKPYSYGQIKIALSPAVWYLSHKPLATTQIFSGIVQTGIYVKNNDGKAGLSFFVKDVTADSWDMYAVEIDSSADTITLVKYVGGTRTVIDSASFTFAPGQTLWLGADFKDYQNDDGRIKVYASLSEGNLIQAASLVISTQDTEWVNDPGGSVGLLSYQANVRFVSFVAGSPEHAEVADVARSLDGPIIAGETKRVRFNRDTLLFEESDDGSTYTKINQRPVELWESDGGAAAWQTDAYGNLYGLGTRDIFPTGTRRGLAARLILSNFTEHFTSGVIPTGYSWQGSPFAGAPAGLSYAAAGDFLGVTSQATRAFLAKSITTYLGRFVVARLFCVQYAAVGWRVDDGSDDNYYEMYYTHYNALSTNGEGRICLRDRIGGGSVSTYYGVLSFNLGLPRRIQLFSYNPSGSNHVPYLYIFDEAGNSSIITAGATHTWTASRCGPIVCGAIANPATYYGGAAYLDGFYDNYA